MEGRRFVQGLSRILWRDISMQIIDYCVLFSTILVVILIGWLSGRKTHSTDSAKEYLLTEKGINRLQAGFSMAATDFGGSGLVGAIGYCYFVGISGVWWNLAAAPAFILVGVFLAKKFHRMDCSTLPEYFGKRYGQGVKLLSCVLHILTNVAALSVQFTVSCTVLHIITGFNVNVSLIISVLIVLFLTSGGLRAVVNTDAVLFVIIVISILLMVPFSIQAVGGYAILKANVPDEFFRFDQLGAWTPISWILLCILNYSTNQNYIQRMVSAKDEGTAKFGALFTAGVYVIISMALGLIGIAAHVLLPGIEDSNMIFATMLVRFFPHGLLGIGLAAVFAATISTGTSMLHATATLIVNDIYVPLNKSGRNDKSILAASRICVFAVALFALGISMFSSNIVNICYIGGLFYGVSAFVPMVLGLHSKFVTGGAALISMVLTVVLSLLWEYLPALRINVLAQIPSNVFGLAVSAVTICVISVLTNKIRKDKGHV